MSLKTRIDRVEALRGGGASFRPSMILISSPGDEVRGAILVHSGGDTVARRDDETEAAFLARIDRLDKGES